MGDGELGESVGLENWVGKLGWRANLGWTMTKVSPDWVQIPDGGSDRSKIIFPLDFRIWEVQFGLDFDRDQQL